MPIPIRKSRVVSRVVSASKIVGEVVVNHLGENLGRIHELVVDARSGRLAYAVLSFGGFLARGNKLFAMPWKAIEFSNKQNKFVLNVDRYRLETAPGFDRDAEWPDFADRAWGDRLDKYYDCEPYWAS